MSYLAIDLGASSGRMVLGWLDGDVMRMDEVHRFTTPLVERDAHLYWDVELMWGEVRAGLRKAFASGHTLDSISVDSWAVDYVPLGLHGVALRDPYSYRDLRTAGRMEIAIASAGGADALYQRTGIQFLPFNTLPQVVADLADEPDVARQTVTRLLIAEYFLYRLTGMRVAESTMASTTQLVDVHTGQWAVDLLAAIGDDAARWPRIVSCGTVLGPLDASLVPSGVSEPPVVIASCSHDTAAAVAAVPASGERAWAFISSGTWSLIGTERSTPVLTRDAREAGFTNEAGLDGTVRFLTNRAGMWVLEECRREWEMQGEGSTHDTLFTAAAAADSSGIIVNLNAPEFAERGGMVHKLAAACTLAGGAMPSSQGGVARLVLESLADSHAIALDQLESLTGESVHDVHIVGGGSMNGLLNQLTADRCGRQVLAGPEEATVLGNLLVQARTLHALPPDSSVRAAARHSTHLQVFSPRCAGHTGRPTSLVP